VARGAVLTSLVLLFVISPHALMFALLLPRSRFKHVERLHKAGNITFKFEHLFLLFVCIFIFCAITRRTNKYKIPLVKTKRLNTDFSQCAMLNLLVYFYTFKGNPDKWSSHARPVINFILSDLFSLRLCTQIFAL
jgi:hypothetical protein